MEAQPNAKGTESTALEEAEAPAVPDGNKERVQPTLRNIKNTVKIPTSLQTAREMAAQPVVQEEKQESLTLQEREQAKQDWVDQPYNDQQLLEVWKEYAEQVKAAGRQGEYIVLKETPELAENHAVRVRIANSMQQDFFEKAKPAAQAYLRQSLRNNQISLGFIMVKEEEGKRLYTAQEKFGYLLKKYPQLKELKDRLGLEADF